MKGYQILNCDYNVFSLHFLSTYSIHLYLLSGTSLATNDLHISFLCYLY